jgi:hypothetical protein
LLEPLSFAPFPFSARQTGHADFPHPASGWIHCKAHGERVYGSLTWTYDAVGNRATRPARVDAGGASQLPAPQVMDRRLAVRPARQPDDEESLGQTEIRAKSVPN